MPIFELCEIYGLLSRVNPAAVEAAAIVALAILEGVSLWRAEISARAMKGLEEKSVKLSEDTLNLQKVIEEDRKRIHAHAICQRIAHGGHSNLHELFVLLYNLNEGGIFWESITATVALPSGENQTVRMQVESIVPGFDSVSSRIPPGNLPAAWRPVRVICVFRAHGQLHTFLATDKTV